MSDGVALDKKAWWQHLNGYHWYVFVLAALGWLFDTMDGQIFLASRSIAIRQLMPDATPEEHGKYGGYVTSLFILGWATGGLIFGIVGDRWGRAKTMALTILIYAVFTGLSGISTTWWHFGIFRFLTGLGVGGEFAAGAALVAEVMPEQARAKALGMLQALSAVGNMMGAGLFWVIEPAWGWQWLYFVGAFPALLAVVVRMGLKEPEKWTAAKAAGKAGGKSFGSMSELFTSPRWRRNTLCGLGLGISGVLGLWGVGFFSPELMDASFPSLNPDTKAKVEAIVTADTPESYAAAVQQLDKQEQRRYTDLVSKRLKPADTIAKDKALTTPLNAAQKDGVKELLGRSMPDKEITSLKAKGLILQQIGAFFGIMMFSILAARFGRRPAFWVSFLIAWFSVVVTFYSFNSPSQVWYLYPLLGFGTLAPFGGYALYFPELFPTRLRTTGTGFCYNVGRYVSALGPAMLGLLAAKLHGKSDIPGFRAAALIVSCAYIIGIVTTFFAPETLNQPLPDDGDIGAGEHKNEPVLAH